MVSRVDVLPDVIHQLLVLDSLWLQHNCRWLLGELEVSKLVQLKDSQGRCQGVCLVALPMLIESVRREFALPDTSLDPAISHNIESYEVSRGTGILAVIPFAFSRLRGKHPLPLTSVLLD